MQRGFSLVELSIVLVILGLLTGGILAGQSLIRAAELRAVSTEYNKYVAAMQGFRDKYFSVPGDFRDATKFWGRQVNAAHCVTNSSAAVATPGTCDGNGDAYILAGGGASQSVEWAQFWRQLANAGLVEGGYTGLAGTVGGWGAVGGENEPASKLRSGIWTAQYYNQIASNTYMFNGDYGYAFQIGAASTSNVLPGEPIMKPEELWNIDTKLDDGKPATGRVVVYNRQNCALTAAGAALTGGSGEYTLYDAIYNLASSTTACAAVFRRAF